MLNLKMKKKLILQKIYIQKNIIDVKLKNKYGK